MQFSVLTVVVVLLIIVSYICELSAVGNEYWYIHTGVRECDRWFEICAV